MRTRTLAPLLVVLAVLVGLGVWGARWWEGRRHLETTDNAYVRAGITMIASRISGYVTEVPPPTHTHVLPGDVLAVFDDGPFRAAVEVARARVGAAEANLAAAGAEVATAEAESRLKEARAAAAAAERDHADAEFRRADTLLERESVSRRAFDAAQVRLVTAEHDANAADADAVVARSELVRARAARTAAGAGLEAAQAELRAASIELDDTRVLAPVEGWIANQTVEVGFYIEEGWPMMAVVPLHGVWITANFKETQLENMRVGQEVRIRVDAFPGHDIRGHVLSLAPASAASFSLLPPQNASGNFVKVVQRVPVKIRFEVPPELENRIVPGMSAVVTVDTRTAPAGTVLSERAE